MKPPTAILNGRLAGPTRQLQNNPKSELAIEFTVDKMVQLRFIKVCGACLIKTTFVTVGRTDSDQAEHAQTAQFEDPVEFYVCTHIVSLLSNFK